MIRLNVASLLACLVLSFNAQSQTITIDGVADRTTYTDRATFRVQTNAGFTYEVTLNGAPMPAGVSNTVARMDYYDLAVARTDTTTLAISHAPKISVHAAELSRRGARCWVVFIASGGKLVY